MTLLHAIVLALLQGLTEFLPISSSAHLILVPRMLGWPAQPLSFDVALHQGTTLAVLLYFRRDFVPLARQGVGDALRHRWRLAAWSPLGRLALLVVLGCVPAVIVGGLFGEVIEERVREAYVLICALLVLFGLVMLAAERWAAADSALDRLDGPRALVVGVAQTLALIPGVSRSGATIAAGMFAGLTRETAARFSFLLSAPIVVAAGVASLPDLRLAGAEGVGAGELLVGVALSFVSGLLAIHVLLRYVARHSLHIFVWYRIAFALLALAVLR